MRNSSTLTDPCYAQFKEDLLKTKATQPLVYFIGCESYLLTDAREEDDQLHLIAALVYALVKLDHAVSFQKRIDDMTHYCIKTRWEWTERKGVKFGRKVSINKETIYEAERLIASGELRA